MTDSRANGNRTRWVPVQPALPAVPWLSCFPETNLRTYVTSEGGERGIWFFTLEAARLVAVAAAHVAYGMPYHWAEMRINTSSDTVEYWSRRRRSPSAAYTSIIVRPGDSVKASALEAFLTARFRLYTMLRGRLA